MYSKRLEGNHGRDRVQRCCLLASFQEGLESDHGGIQESEDERLTKLDNRIERAREGHELTRLVIRSIFLV